MTDFRAMSTRKPRHPAGLFFGWLSVLLLAESR